jgi:hypothetical protein
MELLISLGFLGFVCMCIKAIETGLSPSNGFLPVSISNSITPTE